MEINTFSIKENNLNCLKWGLMKKKLMKTDEKTMVVVCEVPVSHCYYTFTPIYISISNEFVRDPIYAHSELTVKLEPGFLSGLRSPHIHIRQKFFEVYLCFVLTFSLENEFIP